tara:strand:- start:115 stop:909 length:795 start_codon:yes stop_codon:yes gene_type:complete
VGELARTSTDNDASIIDQYTDYYDDSIVKWRDLGARYKSHNIIKVAKGTKYTNVLDCGAGEGSVLKHLNDSDFCQNLYAIEISDSGIEKIKNLNLTKLKEVKKFDGYQIPFPDDFFDLVYCTHVIEHVEHPRMLLREIKRVSKSQIFEVPLDFVINVDKYYKSLHSFGHINVYSPSSFRYLLKSEGFTIKHDFKTKLSKEILRFDMYKNRNIKKTLLTELKLILIWPMLDLIKRILWGAKRYNEFGYSAYTCLLEADGEIEIIF